MRPRLRRDVLYTQTPGGVLFHNADGGFHLAGRTAYRFASLIVPHLDGSRPLTDICAGLGAAQRAMVAELVGSLVERDFARDAAPATAPGPPAAVAERFAAQIAYVDHYVDGAAARFDRFRETRVAVLGTGEAARWCVLGLIRNGLAEVAAEERPEAALAEADELTAAGSPAVLTPVDAGALSSYQVLLVTGADAPARTHALLRAGLAEGQLLIPAWTFGDRVVVGPRSGGLTAGCLGCTLLRLGDTTDPAAAAALLAELAGVAEPAPAPAGGALTGPVAAMVGNLLAYEVFRTVTGALPAETEGQVLIQDLDSLDVVAEPLRPHPRCPRCADPGAGAGTGAGAAELRPDELTVAPTVTVETAREAEELVAGLNRLGDALIRPHVGVFTRYRDEELTQTPLKVTRIEVPAAAGPGRPAAPGRPTGPRLVAAFDVHHLAGARQRGIRTAATLYAEHAAPVRPLRELPARIRRLGPDALVADAGTGVTADDVTAWARTTSLLTKDEVAVPAAALCPAGAANRDGLVLRGSWGTGAGESAGEAAGHALLSALAHRGLLRAVRGGHGATPARAQPTGDDPEWVFLTRSVETLGVAVELLDLGESERTGVSVALAREPGVAARWAVGAALTPAGAAVAALRDLLGQVQLAAETGEAPDTGDELLPDLAPGAVRLPEADPDPDPKPDPEAGAAAGPAAEAATFPAVLERLRAAGQDVLWCDTTPVDLRSAGLHTARVLLTKEGTGGDS